MAITSDLDNIVKWFEEEVCPSILLKVPDDKVNDGGYNVQTAHPAAFAMYIPTQDRKPPDVAAPIPSLCVQLLKGKHAPAQHIGQMTIQLALATWNPGQHGSEMAVPEQDPQALGGGKVDETVKNDIATAERLRITATTLDGILTVKGQGRSH